MKIGNATAYKLFEQVFEHCNSLPNDSTNVLCHNNAFKQDFWDQAKDKKLCGFGTHCDENPELITTVFYTGMMSKNSAYRSKSKPSKNEKNPLRSNGAFKFYDRI